MSCRDRARLATVMWPPWTSVSAWRWPVRSRPPRHGRGRVGAIEPLEDMRQVFGGHALAIVGDGEDHLSALPSAALG